MSSVDPTITTAPVAPAIGADLIAEADGVPEIHPFPGLRPFREEEAHLFFGREEHRSELLKRLTATRFVAVVGTSGSGKSSLIRAGLLPDMYSGYLPKTGSNWVIIDTSPGNDPIGRLAQKFNDEGWPIAAADLRTNSAQILESARQHLVRGQHLLVLVDQFEELFRLAAREHPVADQDEKASFVRLLLQAGGHGSERSDSIPPIHVIIAMRSEFLGKASTYRGLPEAIDQGQYLIPRLSREQLRKAIESPVHVANGAIEEGLIQRLLSELADDQDQLPILQHALMRSWDYSRRRQHPSSIDDDCYRHSGGLERALSDDATEILEQTRKALGDEGVRIVKRVFQSLRETDVNGGQSRRPTAVADLCDIAQCDDKTLAEALKPFRRRSFILPPLDVDLTPATLIDVSHEALLRRWTTLKGWIDEDDLDRRLYLRIATRAAEEAGSTNPDYFAPPLLGVLQKFWEERKPTPHWALRHHPGFEQARDFLRASGQHQEALDKAAAWRAKRRGQVGTASGLITIALVLAGVWIWRAAQTQKVLESQARLLESQVVAAKAANASDSDIETRIQLAADALTRAPALDTQRLLLASIFSAARPRGDVRLEPVMEPFERIVLSGKGDLAYVNGPSELRVVNLATGAQVWRLAAPDERPLLVQTADGGRVFLPGTPDRILDASTGRELASLKTSGSVNAYAAAFSEDTVAASGAEAIWTCHTSKACKDLVRHPTPGRTANDIELSKDGRLLVALDPGDSGRPQIRLYQTSPWKLVKQKEIDSTGPLLAQSLDETSFTVCSATRLTSYDTYDNSLDKGNDSAFPAEVGSCQFAGDSSLVTVHRDRTLRVWSAAHTQVAVAPARGADPAVALSDRTIAVLDAQRIGLWEVNFYGQRPGSEAYAPLSNDGTRAFSDRWLDLDSGRETLLDPPPGVSVSRRALGTSSRTAIYLRRSIRSGPDELVFMETRETGKAVERWHVPFPVSEGSPLIRRASTISISADDRYVSLVFQGRPDVLILDAADGRLLRKISGTMPLFVPGKNEVLVRESTRAGPRFAVWPIPDGPPQSPEAPNEFRPGQVGAIAFSGDGRWLAAAEAAGDEVNVSEKRAWNVRVWEWPTFVLRATLAHSAPVTGLAFGNDAATVLTATESTTTIHVWTTEPTEEIARVPYRSATDALSSSPSMAMTSSRRLTFSDSTGVTVLPIDVQQWIQEGCSRISRNLSREEWSVLFGPNVDYKTTCPNRP